MHFKPSIINSYKQVIRRSQLPGSLRRGSAAARFLGLQFRILPGVWMFISCDCLLLSGRRLCDGPITRPEESYGMCVCVCVSNWVLSRIFKRGSMGPICVVAPKENSRSIDRILSFFKYKILVVHLYC